MAALSEPLVTVVRLVPLPTFTVAFEWFTVGVTRTLSSPGATVTVYAYVVEANVGLNRIPLRGLASFVIASALSDASVEPEEEAFGVPVPYAQAPAPAAFFARTRTRYSVLLVRLDIVCEAVGGSLSVPRLTATQVADASLPDAVASSGTVVEDV